MSDPTSKKNVETVMTAKKVHLVKTRRYTSEENTTTHVARKKMVAAKNTSMTILCSRRTAYHPTKNHGRERRIDTIPIALRAGVLAEKEAIALPNNCWIQRASDAMRRKAAIWMMMERTRVVYKI
jgi:hypothetical protein